jgi:hypothetical protein
MNEYNTNANYPTWLMMRAKRILSLKFNLQNLPNTASTRVLTTIMANHKHQCNSTYHGQGFVPGKTNGHASQQIARHGAYPSFFFAMGTQITASPKYTTAKTQNPPLMGSRYFGVKQIGSEIQDFASAPHRDDFLATTG